MSSQSLGDIDIILGVDASDIVPGLDAAVSSSKAGSSQMAGSFSDAADAIANAGEAIKKTSQGMGDSMSDAARRAAAASETMGEAYRSLDVQSTAALQRIATQAQKAFETIRNSGTASTGDVQRAFAASQDAMRDYQNALNGVSSHSHEAAGGTAELLTELLKMGGIALTAGALEHLASEALSVYANFEKTTIAITALTGSVGGANQAIDEMRAISKDDALSFPTLLTAYQRMLAFGFETEQIPGIMRAAADTAAATGSTIERVAGSIDRMAMSGAAGAKQLATLGLQTKDMAAAMNVAESQVKSTFKALDEAQRVEVLTIALDKFRGTAEQMAESLSGQWQSLKNKAEITFEDVGKALAPAAIALIDLGKTGLESTEMLAKGLQQFSDSVVLLVGQINTIGGAFGDLVERTTGIKVALDEAKAAAVLADAGFSATLPTWKALASVWGQAALALQVLTDSYPKSLVDLKALTHQATTSGAEFKAAFDVSAAQAGLGHLDEATQKVVDGQAKLQKAVDDSRHALDVLTTSYQTQTVMANGKIATDAQVRAAQDELTAAVKKLEGAHRSHVLTLGELVAKQVELNADVVKAQAVYDAAQRRLDGTTQSANLVAEAYKQLQKALKAASDQETDAVRIAAEQVQATQRSIDKANALVDATEVLIETRGLDDAATQASIRTRDAALKQIGTTIDAFRGLIDVTSEHATNLRAQLAPALAAIDLAHIEVAQHAAMLGSVFHDVGIKSTAEYKDLADKLAVDFKLISESGTASAGDIAAAQEKLIKAQENYRDSLSPTAAAFKDLGIKSSQSLSDFRDEAVRLYQEILQSGEATSGDLARAWDKVKAADRTYLDSLGSIADAYATLGIKSSASLKRQADDAQAAYQRIAGSGAASSGDVQRAFEASQKAADDYRNSLGTVTAATNQVGAEAGIAGPRMAQAFQQAIPAVNSLAAAIQKMEADWQTFTSGVGSFSPQIGARKDQGNPQIASFGGFSGSPTDMLQQFQNMFGSLNPLPLVNGAYSDSQAFFIKMETAALRQALANYYASHPNEPVIYDVTGAASPNPNLPKTSNGTPTIDPLAGMVPIPGAPGHYQTPQPGVTIGLKSQGGSGNAGLDYLLANGLPVLSGFAGSAQDLAELAGYLTTDLTAAAGAMKKASVALPNLTDQLTGLGSTVAQVASTVSAAISDTAQRTAVLEQVNASPSLMQTALDWWQPGSSTGLASSGYSSVSSTVSSIASTSLTKVNNITVTDPNADKLVQEFINKIQRMSGR